MSSTDGGALDARPAQARVLAGFLALGVWWGAWGAVIPAVQATADVSDGQLGTAVLFVGAGALLSMRLTGALIDRSGSRVLPVALVVFATAGLLPGVVRGPLLLAVALSAVGIASGAVDVGINTASAQWEALNGRPLMNLAHATFSIGVVIASLTTGLLRRAGIGAFGVLLAAAVGVTILAAFIAFEPSAAKPAAPARDPHEATAGALDRRLVIIGTLTAMAFLVENGWQTWSAVHLERQFAASAAAGALGPAAFAVSAATGRLAGQRLTRRFAPQRLVAIGGVVAAAGTVIAALAPHLGVSIIGIAVAGVGTAVCAPTLLSIAAAGVADRRRGAVIGSVTTLAYLGFVLAPAAIGLGSRLTSLRFALAAVAVIAVGLAVGSSRARPAGPS